MIDKHVSVGAVRDQVWMDLDEHMELVCAASDDPAIAPEWLTAKVFNAIAGELFYRRAERNRVLESWKGS